MKTRRRLLLVLGASMVGATRLSRAQPRAKLWRIGFLTAYRRPDSLQSGIFGAFLKNMRELGYLEGKNLIVEWRFADGRYERFADLAEELVRLGVDLIVTMGSGATAAAQKATKSIPIVMAVVDNPVAGGFVKSLAHPGGNITGLSNLAVDVGPKQLEMLHAMVPGLSRVALLLNPYNPSHARMLKSMESASRRTGATILVLKARASEEIESAFQAMAQAKVHGLVIARDTFFTQQSAQIAKLAAAHRLPSISGNRVHAEAGGLMSYGSSLLESVRHAAVYVDKIFKGAKPADLPVEEPAKLELVINRRTAKALGLAIPPSLLTIADELIE